jgi:hypothetical protein
MKDQRGIIIPLLTAARLTTSVALEAPDKQASNFNNIIFPGKSTYQKPGFYALKEPSLSQKEYL